jgi:D-alanyl-D-alanine carboxypeptidase/D-alanyl-D-alanine-endopeptidase (penicillin-binding protein 4)
MSRRDSLAVNQVDVSSVASAEDDAAARRRITLISIAAAVIFLLLGTGSVFAGIAATHKGAAGGGQSAPTSTNTTRAVPADEVAAAALPTCSISSLASKTALGSLYTSVRNVSTGTQVYSTSPSTGQPPTSAIKVLTAAAAIAKLTPTFRITTKVVDGVTPGSITLVGEGDPTLSAAAAGAGVYAGAPLLSTLATKTVAAYAAAHPDAPAITQVVLDSSYWDPSDNWDANVPRNEQTGGYLSETTALQVDGDRANAKLQVSPRSTDPVAAAGKAFVAALGVAGQNAAGINVVTGQAEDGAPTLASVQSQPVSVLVKQMLLNGDNTLAEQLARIVSVKDGLNGTSASVQQALDQSLAGYGLDTSALTIDDASGESPTNSVSAEFMSSFMALVAKGTGNMKYVTAGIPLAGRSGSLVGRFTGPASAGVGHVFAVPGVILKSYTLNGYVKAKDGTTMSFALYAEGNVAPSANAALDALANGIYECGKNLTTY